MNRKQTLQRLHRDIDDLANDTPATTVVTAQNPDEDGDQVAREAIRSFRDEMEKYQRSQRSDPDQIDPRETPEWRVQAILESPPENVNFFDIERVSRVDPDRAVKLWEDVKAAARRDLDFGWTAGRMLEPPGSSAWERACFLAVRDRLHRAWPPRHGGDAMLLDEMAQYEMIRLHWVRITAAISHDHMFELSMLRSNPDRVEERPAVLARVLGESSRMVERMQRLYQKSLNTLLSMRRTRPPIIAPRIGPINVAVGPQLNACLQTIVEGHS
jgi:hypothetical protein